MDHPHHKHLDSALKRVGEQPPSLAERLAEPRQRNDAARDAAHRRHQTDLEKAHERTRVKLERTRRTRLHTFGLAGGRRTFPEEG